VGIACGSKRPHSAPRHSHHLKRKTVALPRPARSIAQSHRTRRSRRTPTHYYFPSQIAAFGLVLLRESPLLADPSSLGALAIMCSLKLRRQIMVEKAVCRYLSPAPVNAKVIEVRVFSARDRYIKVRTQSDSTDF
jgi:hypothetical protein